jgi:hypothetical protein
MLNGQGITQLKSFFKPLFSKSDQERMTKQQKHMSFSSAQLADLDPTQFGRLDRTDVS